VQALANREVQCRKAEIDLSLTQKAYDKCAAAPIAATRWWQNPVVVIGGVTVAFAVGVAVTALVIK
jgi:hypothetical protein